MKRNKKIFHFFYFLLLVVVLIACSTGRNILYDYSYLYNNNQKLIKPNFKLFHQSKDSSTLYFQINSNNILYGKLASDSLLSANILCKYILYDSLQTKNILDSATIPFYNYNINSANINLQASIKFKVAEGKRYPLEVRFRDEFRDLNVVYFLWLDKRNNGNSQYYLLQNGKQIIFNGVVKSADSLELIKSPLILKNDYKMRFSSSDFVMSPPPFFTEKIGPIEFSFDSIKNLAFKNNKITLTKWAKINEIRPLSDSLFPLYFYQFYKGYPKIMNYEQMVGPLRYITTSTEYKKLLNAKDKKAAIDEFWLSIAGSKIKAKQMIKEYYSRVELANEKFTTYKEGWKTDRGIIYIVFGQASEINKNINSESWVYGEENQLLSIGFQFIRSYNPRSKNDFQLIRNKEYKNSWYLMVDNWRKGNI